jgi:hypothetical protein
MDVWPVHDSAWEEGENETSVCEVDAPMTKKGRKEAIVWNYELHYCLASAVLKYKAHLRTADATMESKWTSIAAELMKKPEFHSYSKECFTAETFKSKWKRLKPFTVAKFALDKEGANLSALAEDPTELEKLVMDICEQEQREVDVKANAKLKHTKQQQCMVVFEKQTIPAPVGKVVSGNHITPPNRELSFADTPIAGGGEIEAEGPKRKKSSPPPASAADMFQALADKRQRLAENKLSMAREKMEKDQELASKKLEIDQEIANKKLELDREKIEVDRMAAETERKKADTQERILMALLAKSGEV